MLPAVDIDAALADPQLLGAAMGNLRPWGTWRVVLKAAFGLPLTPAEVGTFGNVAGGRPAPAARVRELWCVIGRRSGKSRVAALVATYIATCVDHRQRLVPGETGSVLVLAASKSQASVVFGYVKGFLESSPILSRLIEEITADEVRLAGGVVIGVHSNNSKTVRGRTLLGCVFDETGHWRDETSSQPDIET